MLPFEKNIATEITIIDDNLLPTGYYELTFDFFSVSIYFIYSMIEGIMHGCQKVLENITSGYGNHEKKY